MDQTLVRSRSHRPPDIVECGRVRPHDDVRSTMNARTARLARARALSRARNTGAVDLDASMIGTNLQHSATDAWAVWTAPARGEVHDWSVAAGVVALSAAVSPFDDDIDRWAFKHRNDRAFKFLKPVRAGGSLFSGKTLTPIALGTLAVASSPRIRRCNKGCSDARPHTRRAVGSARS